MTYRSRCVRRCSLLGILLRVCNPLDIAFRKCGKFNKNKNSLAFDDGPRVQPFFSTPSQIVITGGKPYRLDFTCNRCATEDPRPMHFLERGSSLRALQELLYTALAFLVLPTVQIAIIVCTIIFVIGHTESYPSKSEHILGLDPRRLRPVNPQDSNRYQVRTRVRREDVTVHRDHSYDDVSNYLPPAWRSTVHPEGNIYFSGLHSRIQAVTPINMHNVSLASATVDWISFIELRLLENKMEEEDLCHIEIFVDIGEDNNCYYYLVNTRTRSIFWLEDNRSDALGLHPVVSASHLTTQLEMQYWTHVESFCKHRPWLMVKDVEELIQIFQHGLCDMLTSDLSTFPYDVSRSEKLISLLNGARDRLEDAYTIAIVARLWSVIMYNRYEIHYGQQQARLCRTMAIMQPTENERTWTKPIFAAMTFGLAAPFNDRLESLFVDHVVYEREWQPFVMYCMTNWKCSALSSTVFIFLHILFFRLPISGAVVYTSVTSAALSIVTALLLVHRHAEFTDGSASRAQDYLSNIVSPYVKFQHAAAVYSLPQVFAISALLAVFVQCIVVLMALTGPLRTMLTVLVFACVALIPRLIIPGQPTSIEPYTSDSTGPSQWV